MLFTAGVPAAQFGPKKGTMKKISLGTAVLGHAVFKIRFNIASQHFSERLEEIEI